MKLKSPFIISSRLMAALKIGDATLSMEIAGMSGSRVIYRTYLDTPEFEHTDRELRSDACGGSLQSGFESYLSFLSAAGEAYRYNGYAMKEDTSTDLFPENVCEWAYQNQDEISMLGIELEETENLIEE